MALRIFTKFPSNIVIDGEVIPIKIKRLSPDEAVDFNTEFSRLGKKAVALSAGESPEDERAAKRFVVKSISEFVEVEPNHIFCDDDKESITSGVDLARLFGARDETLSELLLLIFMENRLNAEQKANWHVRLAPFVQTPLKVAERMMEITKITEKDVVYDLGCGDGQLCIAAARLGAKVFGWDVDTDRIVEAKERAKAAGIDGNCTFAQEDLLKIDLSSATVVALYLLAGANAKLRPILLKALPDGARVVSHAFTMGGDWTPDVIEAVPLDEGEELVHVGQRNIYLYSVDRWRKAHPGM